MAKHPHHSQVFPKSINKHQGIECAFVCKALFQMTAKFYDIAPHLKGYLVVMQEKSLSEPAYLRHVGGLHRKRGSMYNLFHGVPHLFQTGAHANLAIQDFIGEDTVIMGEIGKPPMAKWRWQIIPVLTTDEWTYSDSLTIPND